MFKKNFLLIVILFFIVLLGVIGYLTYKWQIEDLEPLPSPAPIHLIRDKTSGTINIPLTLIAEVKEKKQVQDCELRICEQATCEKKDFKKVDLFRSPQFQEGKISLSYRPSSLGFKKAFIRCYSRNDKQLDSSIISIVINPKEIIKGEEWNTIYFDDMELVKEMKQFQDKYNKAKNQGENWVRSPKSLALEFVLNVLKPWWLEVDEEEIREVEKAVEKGLAYPGVSLLQIEASYPEPEKAVVLITSDGWASDTTSGKRLRVSLIKEGQMWQVEWVGFQLKCYRAPSPYQWQAELCL